MVKNDLTKDLYNLKYLCKVNKSKNKMNQFGNILEIDNGARFHKCDLHVHTPASYDYKNKGIKPEDIVSKALEKGLDVIAITDHHNVDWCNAVRDAAKHTDLVVLPGVELRTDKGKRGIHIIGIFDKDKQSEYIKDMVLNKIGLTKTDISVKGEENVYVSLEKASEAIAKAGGIVTIHADKSSGIEKEIDSEINGELKRDIVKKYIHVMEIAKSQQQDFYLNNEGMFGRQIPSFMCSDAHTIEEIGSKFTWIKTGQCDLKGLKQVIYEPKLRVSLAEPEFEAYPRIVGMDVNGGYFRADKFHFNKDLNCIIGGRGAGKSIIIDLLRFALDMFPRSEEHLKMFADRLKHLLKEGNSVRVFVEVPEDHDKSIKRYYCIERELHYQENTRTKEIKIISNPPKIHQRIDSEWIKTSQSLREIFNAEIFGQGEVFELTKRADDQLKLIDEYADVKDLFNSEEKTIQDFEENAESILELKSELEELDQKLNEKRSLNKRKEELDQILKDQIFVKHELWINEDSFFDEVRTSLKNEKKNIDKLVKKTKQPELPEIDMEQTPNKDDVMGVNEKFEKLYATLLQSRKDNSALIDKTEIEIDNIIKGWKPKFTAEETKFKNKLRESGAEAFKVLTDELKTINSKLLNLEKKVQPEFDEKSNEIVGLFSEREQLLSSLVNVRKNIREKRVEITSGMSKGLRDVKIRITDSYNTNNYFDLLNKIYARSSIRNKEDQLSKLCLSIKPDELAKMIIDTDVADILAKSGITENTAEIIVNMPRADQLERLENIFKIQIVRVEDEPEIMLKKPDEDKFDPLGKLSFGEKCTAILSIALLNKRIPLILDQPEEELDHAFVTKDIVESIRNVKGKRQLVIVTHNANIPVLGDAELIIKVKKVPGEDKCTIEEQGALEKREVTEKVQMLEGGKEAFEKRREKYGIAV